MIAEQKIREALKDVYGEGDVKAMDVFKGYAPDTLENGWHFSFFGRSNHTFLGKSVNEAITTISIIADEREIIDAQAREDQMIDDARYADMLREDQEAATYDW